MYMFHCNVFGVIIITAHCMPQPSLSEQDKIYARHQQVTLCGFPESSYSGNSSRVATGQYSKKVCQFQ